jgi:ATP-binding cassette subfamily B protein
MGKFPFYPQMDSMDCGPACLQMVLKSWGRYFPLPWLRSISFISREGVSLKGIIKAAERVGLSGMAVKIPYGGRGDGAFLLNAPLPLIAHWNQNHFVVVHKANKKFVWIADPASGKHKLPVADFLRSWESDGNKGVALLLDRTPAFYDSDEPPSDKLSLRFVLNYLRPFKRLIVQLAIGLGITSFLSLLFPFLTQAIVDTGIVNQDIGFIYLVLIAQMVLFTTQTVVRFLQNWILLHVGTRMNVSLISDFLVKLMKLPLGYFDTKMTGDLLQRVGDHNRIERFLTQSTLGLILATFNLIAFSAVLLFYSTTIFLIFAVASVLYFGWIAFFLKRRNYQQRQNDRMTELESAGIVSTQEAEQAAAQTVSARRQREVLVSSDIQNQLRVQQLRQQILQRNNRHREQLADFDRQLLVQLGQLRSALNAFRDRYVMIAREAGTVSWQPTTREQALASPAELLGYLLPALEDRSIIARADIPATGQGKIAVGDKVVLDFAAYPGREYGQVLGVLDALDPVATVNGQNEYVRRAVITLSDSLTTSYGKTIPFQYNLSGTARFIIAERTFLERLLEQFLNLTKNT